MERTVNGVHCKVVPQVWDVYFDMALTMLEEIISHNAEGRRTVMIVPVGPTQQYPILAQMVNQLNVSLQNVHFFNMDEYFISPNQAIARTDNMSFYRRMKTEFYDQVKPELLMPPEQRHFPEAGKEEEYDRMISELGGADLCMGGLGVNGHVAFNEAAEPDDPVTADAFAVLGTRVLKLTKETRTINATGYQRGDIASMPQWCISIGIRQILAAGKIYIAITLPWQHGALRRALHDPESPQLPASLLRRNPKLVYCVEESVASGLFE